jgi:aminopeptidase N
MKYFFKFVLLFSFLLAGTFSQGQYTHQDSLRGTLTPQRTWWDVLKYDISVTPDYLNKSITGISKIQFKVLKEGDVMQIDMQQPMVIDSMVLYNFEPVNNKTAATIVHVQDFKRDGNAYFVKTTKYKPETINFIYIYYHGKPRVAINPPWDGGWIFAKDAKGRPWMTVACQGLGASVWYPCKDHQSDEPDNGAILTMTVPDTLVAVGNGRLVTKKENGNGTTSWTWQVKNPINNYNIIPYIGKYVTWHEDYAGETQNLDCDYWVLDYNIDKAKKQFGRDVQRMLKCFEHWFGPYPFYDDSYKLVETPHLGMEHQSAVAYGNHFMDGYLGQDLSGSGWGKKWDYIIIHESGHEWFANNITTNDIADMWIHEGFTMYSEVIFVGCEYGKEAADAYCQGIRKNIDNDRPLIGPYGVNKEGSGDMYNKGANLLHTIRTIINDDEKFRMILRGLNKDFYHKTVDSKDVEAYISKKSGKDFSKVFDQYLRTIKIPVLEYEMTARKGASDSWYLKCKWSNTVAGFAMPVKIIVDNNTVWVTPTTEFKTTTVKGTIPDKLSVDANLYITTKNTQAKKGF